ncbi:LPO_1073/Vpar_1526 family protein [Nocardia sp. NPDC005825]|uniref:LPO_1073/Vpar_1526 family protein n=1 Tax=unclassified Nocardia TaxID=2637762 RepID=UPI0033FA7945
MTASEVVRICTEVMRPEFEKFQSTARGVVEQRAFELLENYMFRQMDRAPEFADSLKQPRMQRALQSAQIEYATSGDADLGSVLVDLVVDLSMQSGRTSYAISVAEAINVAPKLTEAQMNALSVIFCLKLFPFNWSTPEKMYHGFREWILPFLHELPAGAVDYRHMQGLGVGWLELVDRPSLASILVDRYPGLFTYGVPVDNVPNEIFDIDGAIVDSVRTPGRKQIATLASTNWKITLESGKFSEIEIKALNDLMIANLLTEAEVETDLVGNVPELAKLFEVWRSTNISDIELSTIGLVIANANLRSRVEAAIEMAF